MTFQLAESLRDALYAHAESCYPDEACGILSGPIDTVADGCSPCANIQNQMHEQNPKAFPRDARAAYLIDPKALFDLTRECRRLGREFKAIFHSHADVGAYFSDEDQRQAAPVMSLSVAAFARAEGVDERQVQVALADGSLAGVDGKVSVPMPSYPELIYLVVDVSRGNACGLKGFFWNPSQRCYTEISVEVT